MRILMNGYGLMSWCAGRLCVARHGAAGVTSLFCDVKDEDEDTYNWGRAGVEALGILRIEIADGRNPWQVFRDERMIGNTRADPCSKILKRELARQWMAENYPDPALAVVVVGIGFQEAERLPAIQARWAPYPVEAPLCGKPWLWPGDLEEMRREAGLWAQYLYKDGWPHANCGGACIKQGQGGFVRLLQIRPRKYAEVEAKEEAMRQHLGKDVAILRDRRGGTTKPLTLRQLRERVEAGQADQCDLSDFGGCGCFAD